MLVERDHEIEWNTQQLRAEVYNAPGAVGFVEVSDTLALLAWINRDALLKKLDALIDSEADDKSALSHEARQKAEAEVAQDLLACERDEAALVFKAQAQGLPVEHRKDCSPLAILQCRPSPHRLSTGGDLTGTGARCRRS